MQIEFPLAIPFLCSGEVQIYGQKQNVYSRKNIIQYQLWSIISADRTKNQIMNEK